MPHLVILYTLNLETRTDLTALARPVATLLAQRPARRALAVPGTGAEALALAPPLVDAVLQAQPRLRTPSP